jgi:hypothetical protein
LFLTLHVASCKQLNQSKNSTQVPRIHFESLNSRTFVGMSTKRRTVTRKTELRHMTVTVAVTKTRHETTHYNFRYYFADGHDI